MIHEWCLDVTTWEGVSLGAEHFYGKLAGERDGERVAIELTYLPSLDQARRLVEKAHRGYEMSEAMKAARIKWEMRSPCLNFWARDDVVSAGIAKFRELATGPAILVEKDYCSGEAAPLQDSIGVPKAVARRLATLGQRYVKAWRDYQVRAGFYFDLSPRGRAMVDRARREYREILAAT